MSTGFWWHWRPASLWAALGSSHVASEPLLESFSLSERRPATRRQEASVPSSPRKMPKAQQLFFPSLHVCLFWSELAVSAEMAGWIRGCHPELSSHTARLPTGYYVDGYAEILLKAIKFWFPSGSFCTLPHNEASFPHCVGISVKCQSSSLPCSIVFPTLYIILPCSS